MPATCCVHCLSAVHHSPDVPPLVRFMAYTPYIHEYPMYALISIYIHTYIQHVPYAHAYVLCTIPTLVACVCMHIRIPLYTPPLYRYPLIWAPLPVCPVSALASAERTSLAPPKGITRASPVLLALPVDNPYSGYQQQGAASPAAGWGIFRPYVPARERARPTRDWGL